MKESNVKTTFTVDASRAIASLQAAKKASRRINTNEKISFKKFRYFETHKVKKQIYTFIFSQILVLLFATSLSVYLLINLF